MTDPLGIWANLLLRLGLVLTALGFGPVLAVALLFHETDPVVPVLLSFTIGPLGLLALVVSLILFLATLLRRRRGSS